MLTPRRAWPAVLLVLTVVAYAPALPNGFVWDDDDHITANDALRSLDGLRRIWVEPGATVQYYPLTFTVWWGAFQLWGTHPLGYHVLNVLLHALVSLLFWRVLERLRVPGASLAAAIFAVHPVHVMSVAWATELKNTLSTSLALGACLAYLGYAGIGGPVGATAPGHASRRSLYGLTLGLFALAILAKTAVGLLPVTLVLIVWWRRGRAGWRDYAPLAPLAAMGLALGSLTVYVERLTGATGEQFHLGALERVGVSGRSFWFYLGKLVLPVDLTFIYPRWDVGAFSLWDLGPAAAALAALGALWALRERIGKGPLVGVLHFYLGSSALVLFLVLYMTRYSFVSDHWQYMGSLGMIGLGAASAATHVRLHAGRPVAAAVVALLCILTWRQCGVYRDAETLWRATLERNPDAWIAHVNLGTLLAGQGKSDEALDHYVAALANDPFHADPAVRRGAEAWSQGRRQEGLEELRRAIVARPYGYEALSGIGVVLASRKRLEEALDFFDGSVRANPRYASGHLNRGLALQLLGRTREALEAFRETIRLDPRRTEAYLPLARALEAEGRDEEARGALDRYRRLGGSVPP